MSDQFHTDAVIIGAGPVGLFAAFQLGMLGLKCHVIDALGVVGGQCMALYPEKPIYDIPGFPEISGQALIDNLAAQASPFDPQCHLGQQATGLEPLGEPDAARNWRVTTDKGVAIDAAAVLIAVGAGAFGPNRPPLAGLEAYENNPEPGRGVHYLVRKREDFRDNRVVIAGGGDSAVDWALSLAEVAAEVKLVHRRPKFRAAPESVNRLQRLAEEGRVELVTPYQLHALEGAGGQLQAVIVQTMEGQERRLEAEALLPFFGLATSLGPLEGWGLTIEHNRLVVESATMATNLAGVFAIGDIASYPGKYKLILQGFSEAAMAAHAAFAFARPGEALHFEHSTTRGVKGAV